MLESTLAEADKQRQKQPITRRMPPTSHTLMDLIITLSIYLPRSNFSALFSLASLILPQASDPQLQKKAYKLLPRIATSEAGVLALQDRNSELQSLLLTSASTATAPCRRDRLDAVAVVVEHLPPDSLHFIPSILSEVVISTKEVNEKARTAAFELLVLMARKMALGGIIAKAQIPHMASDAPNAQASLEEFFTMVSAGLVGSTPHMVSASIIALTRILYEFHSQLLVPTIEELVSTMDLFLTSANREVVRSVLGFVKVAIISLPESIVKPRLETLIVGLMSWSREHKAHFRARVKHIFERMIRRFGFELIEKYCPEVDKKFIRNIRKAKERRKRKKDAGGDEDYGNSHAKRKNRFENEYDKAIYGSDESSEDASDTEQAHAPDGETNGTYIIEDLDEPLDLLDRKSLGRISSSKPRYPNATKPKKGIRTNADGKLVFGPGADGDDNDDMVIDTDALGKNAAADEVEGDGTLEGGINAYVDAIRGRDAVQRGRGGRLKFSTRRGNGPAAAVVGETEEEGGGGGGVGGGDAERRKKKERSGKGTMIKAKNRGAVKGGPKAQRRGLGVDKVKAGRVGKARSGGRG